MKAFILSTDKDLMASMQRICEANKPSVAIIPSVPSMQAEGGLNALLTKPTFENERQR